MESKASALTTKIAQAKAYEPKVPRLAARFTKSTAPNLVPEGVIGPPSKKSKILHATVTSSRNEADEPLSPETKKGDDDDTTAKNFTRNGLEEQLSELWEKVRETRPLDLVEGQKVLDGPEAPVVVIEEACRQTVQLVNQYVDELIQWGWEALQQGDSSHRQVIALQEELKNRQEELERLQTWEKKSRQTATNLLKALEKSRHEVQQQARGVMVETQLRAELTSATRQRDDATAQTQELERQVDLLTDELRQTKAQWTRTLQEKIKLEQDQRIHLSLAKSSNSHSKHPDQPPLSHGGTVTNAATTTPQVDYYQRKVQELSGQVQGLTAALTEKSRQVDDLRRQLERNMSQQRLAQLRASGNTGTQTRR